MSEKQHDGPVLTVHEVVIPSPVPSMPAIGPISFELEAGSGLMVHIPKHMRLMQLADILHGLTAPTQGEVRYKNICWDDYSPDRLATARSDIGRVFHQRGWVSNLDIDENVRLKLFHHTKLADADILAEAAALARYFELEKLPTMRPAFADPHVLQRCQWVRALLGNPAVLILVYPENDVDPAHVTLFKQKIETLMQQGTAIVWFTMSQTFWHTTEMKTMRKACIDDGQWLEMRSQHEH